MALTHLPIEWREQYGGWTGYRGHRIVAFCIYADNLWWVYDQRDTPTPERPDKMQWSAFDLEKVQAFAEKWLV